MTQESPRCSTTPPAHELPFLITGARRGHRHAWPPKSAHGIPLRLLDRRPPATPNANSRALAGRS
ncbi:hypothetical protein [Streptomyces sp. NPDC059802]|uniref:hypothetical protein n=1 Tax=Streptomyces sp. NPDC059802 TaxID=3346952 RepID=UPI00364C1C97